MWLHVPASHLPDGSTSSPCAPESVVSILGSRSRSLTPEPFVMLRGKPAAPRFLLLAWRKKHWMKLLCGLTCDLSTLDRGAGSWIASLVDTPASPSASPAGDGATKTPATSGRGSQTTFDFFAPRAASSRTWRDTYRWDSRRSSQSLKAWVTVLRRACLQRRKSAPLTRGNGCLSSRQWMTPDASRYSVCKTTGRGYEGDVHLATQAVLWSTPRSAGGMCRATLRDAETVKEHAKKRGRTGTGNLEDQVSLWPTPSARDGRDGRCSEATVDRNSRPLNEYAVTIWSSPLDPTPSTNGEVFSPSRRVLNPLFVEALMCWPTGWTDFAPVETGLSHYRRLMRIVFSGLAFPDEQGVLTALFSRLE